jgi:hypothetical protein
MLQTLRRAQPNRRQQGVSRPVPPPVGGWNARDSLDGMKPQDAVILENWFPRASDVVSRNGCSIHCDTGEGAFTVQHLVEWKSAGSRKLIAACNGKLINVSSSTPSTIGTGFTLNTWRSVNFGSRIFLVNGTDPPQDYDGTTLTATSWSGSGLTITDLKDIAVFKERLFFIEKNTLNFWYAPLKTITGSLTKFPLQYTGTFGGTLEAIGTITHDGGTGGDDLIAFYLSSGEVIIYQGSDPGNASDWALVGRFNLGAPVGGALAAYGSDLIAITQGAYAPLTKVIPFGRAQPTQLDLSDKIVGAVSEATRAYSGNNGWQAILYPKGRMLLFNVPRSTTTFDQHVMNIDTQSWAKFTGWNFACFALFSDHLYGGGTDGKVYKCDDGTSDNGEAIVVDGQVAWNFFGDPGRQKNFTMCRVIFGAVSDPMAAISIGTDFQIAVPTSTVSTAAVDSGGVWDVAVWDVDVWGGALQAITNWQAATGMGYCASMRMRLSLTAQQVTWRSGNMIMKAGGMV